MKLAQLQQAFWSHATRRDDRAPPPARLFVSSDRLAATRRIDIYADMFLCRQVDCLREDFPKLARVLGEDDFSTLAAAYVNAHPSRHHSLAKFGRHVSAFLKAESNARPDLSDLAALEWARCEVFEEEDQRVASLAALSAPGAIDRPLTFIAALRLLRLDHEVAELWLALEQGLPVLEPQCVPSAIVVWRKDYRVFHVALTPHELEAFELAAQGAALAVVCEAFEGAPDPIAMAFRTLGSWFAEGWVAEPK